MKAVAAAIAGLSALVSGVAAQAIHEPADGRIMFGAWVQTEWETPAEFNQRVGLNASVIQISQTIPLMPYNWVTGAGGMAPEYFIEESGTDAAVFLTVYPMSGLYNITQDDYTALGNQILNYTENYDRQVFLRFGPEMNGNWNIYGLQPLRFVQVWREMHDAIRAIVPTVAFVWAPNTAQGYPYSMPFPSNATEAAALDTDNNGQFTFQDSAFAPYWPGPEYVDWVGLSVYWKGPNSQNINVNTPNGYCWDAVMNVNSNNGQQAADPWYTTYCSNATNIACMFAESGAAYHDMIFGDQGVPHVDLQRSWWQDCLTNQSFFEEFPRLKLMMQFEYEKNETDGGVQDHRDYRLTNDTEVLNAFKSDLATASTLYSWANYRPIPTSTPNVVTQTNLITTTDAAGSTIVQTSRVTTSTFSFITVRNTQTAFPSLFGLVESSAMKSVAISVAVFASTCGALLGATAFLLRL